MILHQSKSIMYHLHLLKKPKTFCRYFFFETAFVTDNKHDFSICAPTSSLSTSRAQPTTFRPNRTSSLATAAPMPAEAPVTRATLPRQRSIDVKNTNHSSRSETFTLQNTSRFAERAMYFLSRDCHCHAPFLRP